MQRKTTLAAALALALAGGTILGVAPAAAQAAPTVAINEIQSQGQDFIELVNFGDEPVDVSDWTFTDDNTGRTDDRGRFSPGTVIARGEFLLLWGEGHADAAFDFGLGGGDAVNLYDAAETLIDSHEYPAHAGDGNTWGRIPDGTGSFVITRSTPGEPNQELETEAVDSPIVINEVESNGDPVGDWVELANTDAENSVDISGWSILDSDPTHTPIVFPEGTVVESHGYVSFYTDLHDEGFGLGGSDSVTLFNAEGEIVDQPSWVGHAATTWGRIPDMTGDFEITGEPTRDMPNIAAGPAEEVNSTPWPWAFDELVLADAPNTFDGDISGADFDAEGTGYVVHNGEGRLFLLEFAADGTAETIASYQLRFADGTGIPDAEGVTVVDGAVYVATERDNAVSGESRPSVLRFDLPAQTTDALDELSAVAEWNLADSTGPLGANGGLEAIEWIPDHFGGVFAVGVEQTGEVLFVRLDDGGGHELVERWQSPFQGVMALDYDELRSELLVLCDEVCEGRSVLVTIAGGDLVAASNEAGILLFDRPAALPNVANEGFARHTAVVVCGAGTVTTTLQLWTDDNNTDGHSLRTGITVIDDCQEEEEPVPTEPAPSEPAPTSPGTPDTPDEDAAAAELPRTGAEPARWLLALAAAMLIAAAGVFVGERRIARRG